MTLLACLLLSAHFIGDFVLQTNSTAIRKSDNWLVLLYHVMIVTACILVATTPWGIRNAILIASINGVAHFATDAVTSRITKYFYSKGERHNFFVTIGADQLIHSLTLVLLAEHFTAQ